MGKIEDILEKMGITYSLLNGSYYFECNNIRYRVDENKKVYVSSDYYGLVPHIMSDGMVCTAGNSEIKLVEDDENLLEQTIRTYVPWLFSMPANFKVAEFLSELDFYLYAKYESSCVRSPEIPVDAIMLQILNPQDLWDSILALELNKWYRVTPAMLTDYYVYFKQVAEKAYVISFDESTKARQRVNGLSITYSNNSVAFVGVGSVNSYIIKRVISLGVTNIHIIDFDKVEIGNMFRFAFPYLGLFKVDAADLFSSSIDQRVSINKIYEKIDRNSKNYLELIEEVFVSVDSFTSWIEVYEYIKRNAHEGLSVNFVAVDAFGRYGKFIKSKYCTDSVIQFRLDFLEFLLYTDADIQKRRAMIGNGCGKAIAVYSEEKLIKLAREVVSCDITSKVIQVSFDD